MDADCLAGNHVSGIDAASGRLECSADAADWSTIGNRPAAFPPDVSSQAWQDMLAALVLKAPLANPSFTGTVSGITKAMVGLGNVDNTSDAGKPVSTATQAALDAKLAASALNSTLIVSKFNGGACAGYLKSDGGCDMPSGSEGTPSLDEISVSGSVYSSKPFKVAGTQTDMEVVEGTPVEVAGENHWSVDSATHRPAYSYNGGIANKVAFVGDSIAAEAVSGLGDAALKTTGTGAGTVAAGDDSRITGAIQSTALDIDGTMAANSDAKVASQKATRTYADTKIASSAIDTDGTLAADSDAKVASQKATKTYADTKLASSALDSALIVSKFASGSCSGYLKNDGTCSVPTGTESTPSMDETTTAGAVHSSKPVEVAGTQTDFKVTEGTPVVVTSENHLSVNSTTHHPAYSYNGGAAKDVLLAGDAITAAQLPKPTTAALGGVYSDADCAAGQHFNGIDTSTGKLKCAADASSYTLPALTASVLGGVKGNGALACTGTKKVTGFASDGTMQCGDDEIGTGTGWYTAPATTHSPDTESFSGAVDVTVGGCSGGTAYYTTDDGSTISSYSSAVHLTATTTLKSRCQKTGYDNSAVKTSTYTLSASGGVVGLMIPMGMVTDVPRYFSPAGYSPTESYVQIGSPIAGSITAVYCNAAVAPSGGTDVVKLRLGGADVATCTIANGTHATTVDLSSSPVTLAKGDLIDGAVTTLRTNSSFSLMVRVEGVTTGVAVLPMFTVNNYPTGGSRNFVMGQNSTGTGLAVGAPLAGTLAEMYFGSNISTASEETFAINDRTAAAAITSCPLTSGNHASCANPLASLVQGNKIDASAVNASGSDAHFGLYGRVESTDATILPFFTSANISASGTAYFAAGSQSTVAVGDVGVGSPIAGTVKSIYAVSSYPAAVASNVTLNINGTPSTITCSITDPAKTCSYTSAGGVSISKGDLLSITANNGSASSGAFFAVYLRVEGAN